MPDISLTLLDKFQGNFEYYVNHHTSFNSSAKSLLRDSVDDYKKIMKDKKMVFIWGKDKPFIASENGKYFSYFFDNIDDCVGPLVQEKYHNGWYDELFYWTPDMPLLTIKQAHVMKNFLKICNDPTYYSDKVNATWYNPTINKWLRMDMVKKVIYPKWSLNTFVERRTPSYIFSLRDEWLWKSNSNLVSEYIKIIKYYTENIPNSYDEKSIFDESIKKKRLTTFFSKKYWLE
jgi:hypothetical protein